MIEKFDSSKERIIQEFVPGKQITLAHIIPNPVSDLYSKMGMIDGDGAIGIFTITPSEGAIIAADVASKAGGIKIGFVDRFNGTLIITGEVASVEAAMNDDNHIFLVTQKDPQIEDPGFVQLFQVGTVAYIKQVVKLPDNLLRVLVEGTRRAELLGLENLLKQRPKNLSGGQRQRVAIGNAIIREPKVLLMDEPLSNLDAKLRTQMRVELAGIHKALGNTIIYVTHDQTEAMTLGDRIVVMNQGAVQQADTPQNLYAYPVNRFVAGFIGSPSMNFIKGLAMEKMGIPTFCTEQDGDIPIPDFLWKILKRQGYIGRNIELGIRPEHFLEKPAGADTRGEWKMEVTVTARELLGAEVILHFNHNGQDCCAKVSGDSLIDKGDSVTLWIDMAYISAFDMETQENITLKRGAFS